MRALDSSQKQTILSSPLTYGEFVTFGPENEIERWVAAKWLRFVYLQGILPILRASKGRAKNRPRILVLEAPVRHGKTTFIAQIFPAWYTSLFSNAQVIIATNTQDLAQKHTTAIRALHQTSRHKLLTGWTGKSAARRRVQTPFGGQIYALGVGSAISGLGAHLALVDDIYGAAEQAMSSKERDNAYQWFKGDLMNRFEPGGFAILTFARWHEDDLIGRLMRETPEQVHRLRLPAFAEGDDVMGRAEGEPLWAERFPKSELLERKRDTSEYFWRALYQQRPSSDAGTAFRERDIHYYTESDTHLITDEMSYEKGTGMLFAVTDTAKTVSNASDYTVCQVWEMFGIDSPKLFLREQWRVRLESPDIVPLLKEVRQQWRFEYVGVEGIEIYQYCLREGLPARELKPVKSKWLRAQPAISKMRRGEIYLPQYAEWLQTLIGELLAFPVGAHDDQVDAFAYAVNIANNVYLGI